MAARTTHAYASVGSSGDGYKARQLPPQPHSDWASQRIANGATTIFFGFASTFFDCMVNKPRFFLRFFARKSGFCDSANALIWVRIRFLGHTGRFREPKRFFPHTGMSQKNGVKFLGHTGIPQTASYQPYGISAASSSEADDEQTSSSDLISRSTREQESQ